VGIYQCNGQVNQKWYIKGQQIASGAAGNKCLSVGGNILSIWVFSNAQTVELVLNGESLGNLTVPQYRHVEYSVAYIPGTIVAKGYDQSGNLIVSDTQTSSGNPAEVRLTLEFPTDGISADMQDTALIAAAIVDSNGRVVPTASNYVQFQVSGPGQIIGVGNGDPSCHEPDKGTGRSAFNGLARVLVSATDKPGTITVTATSSGLKSGSVSVKSSSAKKLPML